MQLTVLVHIHWVYLQLRIRTALSLYANAIFDTRTVLYKSAGCQIVLFLTS